METNGFKDRLKSIWAVIKKYAKRVWEYLKVAKMEYIVMISLFALDLISKSIVNATVGLYETVVLIPKFLNINNIHNYDAAFGADWLTNAIGSMGARILFCIFAVVASVVFIIVLIRAKGGSKLFRVSLAMVTAGAMGNCIDRMFLGYVRDFIEFVYFGLTIGGSDSFYVFNFADAELVIGVILIVIYFIFIYKDKDDKKKEVVGSTDGEAVLSAPTAVSDEKSVPSEEAVTGDPDETEQPTVEPPIDDPDGKEENAEPQSEQATEPKDAESVDSPTVEPSDGVPQSEQADVKESVETPTVENNDIQAKPVRKKPTAKTGGKKKPTDDKAE